jgi:hypothetical protein
MYFLCFHRLRVFDSHTLPPICFHIFPDTLRPIAKWDAPSHNGLTR